MTYKVEKIGDDSTWVEVPSDKLCYTATKDNVQADTFDACELFIRAEVAPQGTEFFRVEVVAEDTKGREALLVDDTVISNEQGMSLSYVGQDDKDRALFSFTEKANDTPQNMAFSLQYYNPATGNDGYPNTDNAASGAYLFKPKRGDSDKKQYSNFVKIETYKAEATGVNAFVVYYSDDTSGDIYTSIIRCMPGATSLEWEVQMHGISAKLLDKNDGKEVVVNWELLDFSTADTFFTDSNGLEMQKRVLN